MSEATKPQIKKYKIDRARLFKGSKHSMYLHEDIAITIIMQSRLSDSKAIPLLKAFYAEKIKLQYKVLENKRVRTEMYFLSIHFKQKLKKKDILMEIKTKKTKDKQKQKKILTANLIHLNH